MINVKKLEDIASHLEKKLVIFKEKTFPINQELFCIEKSTSVDSDELKDISTVNRILGHQIMLQNHGT